MSAELRSARGKLVRLAGSAGDSVALQAWQVDDTPADTAFVDQTTGFNDATSANLTPFPATEATDDYFAVGLDQPFSAIVFDCAGGTAGTVGTVDWEYWNGTAWTTVSGLSDGTTGFTAGTTDGQSVSWDMPSDWDRRVIDSSPLLYYVRAVVTAPYTVNPVYDQGFIRVYTNEPALTTQGADLAHFDLPYHDNWLLEVSEVGGAAVSGAVIDIWGFRAGNNTWYKAHSLNGGSALAVGAGEGYSEIVRFTGYARMAISVAGISGAVNVDATNLLSKRIG